MYTNVEAERKNVEKVSYPAGQAKDDWKIISYLAKLLTGKDLFSSLNALRKSLENESKNSLKIDQLPNTDLKFKEKVKNTFFDEDIIINSMDYYFSNAIARASKTMSDCRATKRKNLKNGTNN